jgi:DNA-directed RNA polymerase specialized sigma24 family protein
LEPSPYKKKDTALTKEELDRLLAFLNPDPEKAANEFVKICKKLIFFFQSRGCCSPEYYADVTIKRVARKLIEGVEIRTNNPMNYINGVANKVLLECLNDPSQKNISLDDPSTFVEISQDPIEAAQREAESSQHERDMECLDECLKKLSLKDRDFIFRYYQGEKSVKIRNRKKLAEEQGRPLNAVRIKAFRIRVELQDCVSECIKRSTDA